MKLESCVCCGAATAMVRFENETVPAQYRQFVSQVDGLSGWRCKECGEGQFDPESARAYTDAGDQLLLDARQQIAGDMRRIRRKLNLTQRAAVDLLSGGGHNAFSRYERADVEPPKPLVVLMALLDKHPELIKEIMDKGEVTVSSGQTRYRGVALRGESMPMATPHM